MKKNIIEKFLKNKTLLITGATGSLGREIIHYLLSNKIKLKKLIIFSRDELKQVELEKIYKVTKTLKLILIF